ncbi:MAG: hypothetical protein M1543_02605, partial [Firmicutes bacterium]|nr:hypothetical protein [Bacillota bacterium]
RVGREGCRHFASLLLECCDTIMRCAVFEKWPGAKETGSKSREDYLQDRLRDLPSLKDSCLAFRGRNQDSGIGV